MKAFKSADHGDPKRREAYFSRHGKAAPKNSAKWFSHKFLWGRLTGVVPREITKGIFAEALEAVVGGHPRTALLIAGLAAVIDGVWPG